MVVVKRISGKNTSDYIVLSTVKMHVIMWS